jgi:photosystem II stability/assembly factor-like uncharacterized protein
MPYERTDEQVAEKLGLNVEQVRQIQRTRGLTTRALDQISEDRVPRLVRRLNYFDLPRAREAFRRLSLVDERGTIPPNALTDALRQLDGLRSRTAAPRVAGLPAGAQVAPTQLVAPPPPPPTAGLSPALTGWQALGPGNIGGRTRAIVVHPTNHQTIWAGGAGGGIWRTDNGGTSWQPVDDLMANLAICCMVIDPTNAKIIYAGTGEGFSNGDALRGAGIFRTTDGTSWTQLSATTTADFQFVNRLAISANGKVLLAATPNGLFRSEDKDRLTWTKVLNTPIADVDFHPSNSSQAVAGGLENGQGYYSTDGGKTWKTASHPGAWSGRVEVTYAASNPSTVYASVQMTFGDLWRSTDRGRTYAHRDTLTADGEPARYLGDQGWYDNVLWAGHPGNADFVIVGGVDLWKSTDGGNTLIDISSWWDAASAHADHHCIVAHPAFDGVANKTVFFGNDGGVFEATDVTTVGNNPQPPRTNGWTKLDNTYSITQFYSGAGNPGTGTIIGGAQDNGTLRYTSAGGANAWTEMFGGDGGWCAADSTDPNYFYGEYVYLNIHRSTDGGASADYISGQYYDPLIQDWRWKPIPYRIPDAQTQQALFIAPFVLDPNQPNCLLGGGQSLWRTNDAKTPNTNSTGPTWISIKGSIGEPITTITVAPGNSDLIWVGHLNGAVYKTTNGTQPNPVWQKIDQAGPSPLTVNRYCTRISIDPQNNNIVYATFGGYVKGNVWKTTDGGTTWSNIGNTLPEAPVRALAIHPRKQRFLYLGSEVGVFASEDAGATWSPTNEGPTNCSVDDLFWMKETLVCVTHGRGMFQIDLSGV